MADSSPKTVHIAIAVPETPVSSGFATLMSPAPAAASSSATRPLLAVKKLGCFTIPSKKDHRSRTGLVQCVVRRQVGQGRFGFASSKLVLFLQNRDGTETAVLTAVKAGGGTGRKFVISDHLGGELGTLASYTKVGQSFVYSLFSEQGQVACVVYQIPSLISVVLDGPPRRAQIAIAKPKVDKTGMFEAKVKAAIKKTRTLEALADLGFANVFQTKSPYSKGGGRWGLNFHGRGREASSKNMQLEDDAGNVMVQVAKWDTNTYNVDFRAPFNMYQAFGFAIAQLDL